MDAIFFEEFYITKSINYVFMVFLMLYKIYNKNYYYYYIIIIIPFINNN
jgi:hypothetical protein